MTGPLNLDFSKLRRPSPLPTKDEDEPVAGPLDPGLLSNLKARGRTVRETATELVTQIESDAIQRAAVPHSIAPYDPSVFSRGTEGAQAPAAPEERPSIDELLELDTRAFAPSTTGQIQPTDETGEPIRTGESRRQRLERQREEYLRSPEKIRADLENTSRIEAAPEGIQKWRMKLASMRFFTDRSLVEFDVGNSSGFHIGTPLAHPLETAKGMITGLPKFFLDLARQPASLILDKLEPGGYLLPEEKEQYQREVIANYGGLVFGFAVGRTVAQMRAGREFLRTGVSAAERAGIAVPTAELEMVAQNLPRAMAVESTIPGQIVTGVTEGAAGGAFTGAVMGETPEERRNMAATYALMALPAGVAFEGVMGRIRKKEVGPAGQQSVDAHNLSIIRQMQAASHQSFINAENSFLALATNDNLAMAAETVGLNRPVVVQGVSKFRPSELSIIHYRPDGLMDISFGGPPDIADAPIDGSFTVYTGTKTDVPSLSTVASRETGNYLGPGLYVTSDPTVAAEFAIVKPEKGTANVRKLRVQPGKVFDFAEPVDPAVVKKLSSILKVDEGTLSDIATNGDLYDRLAAATGGEVLQSTRKAAGTRQLNDAIQAAGFDIMKKSTTEVYQAGGFRRTTHDEFVVLNDAIVQELGRADVAPYAGRVSPEERALGERSKAAWERWTDLGGKEEGSAEFQAIEAEIDAMMEKKGVLPEDREAYLHHIGAAEGGPGDPYAVPASTLPLQEQMKDLIAVTSDPRLPSKEQMNAMFQVSGFFPHEIVSFLGNDYRYVDPIIGKKGVLEGHKIADASGHVFEVGTDQLRHGPDMAINSFILDKPGATRALLDDFDDFIRKSTGGADIPNKPWAQIAGEYASSRHLDVKTVPAFMRFLSDEFGKRLRDESLSPQEKATYARLVRENSEYRQKAATDLVDAATSNGMFIERQNGAIIIREADTGAYLELAHSPEEALRFVNNTVELRAADLTPIGLPDGVARGLIPVPPPPNGPHTSAFNPNSNGWFGDLRDLFNTSKVGTRFTGMRQVMISLDNSLGTKFFEEVYQPLQDNSLRKFAAMHGDMERAAATSRIARGLSAEQLEQVTMAIETMHPDDMVHAGGLFSRAFTQRELAGAKWFIENQIDVRKAFQYYRALKNLERNPRFFNLPEAERVEPVRKLMVSLNIDEAHAEAARIMGKILQLNKPGELSLYGVTRLAEAVMDGHMKGDDYVAKHFPAADTEAGRKMRLVRDEVASHFRDLAKTFDIPDEQRLGGYFAHLRNFANDEIIANRDGAPVFTSELLRTGEMAEYDRDPVNVLVRYINSGYSSKFTKSAMEKAYEYVNQVSSQITDPAHADYVKRLITENYINEIRGIPHASTGFSEKLINKFLDKIGVKSDISVRRDFVNTFLSLTSSSTIGFRPMQGIRDLHNFTSIYYSRFGVERFGDLMTIMSRVSPEELERAGIIKKSQIGESAGAALSREGVIPTLAPVSVLTAQERLQNSLAARAAPYREAIQGVANAGIKWGLQHNVYQFAHAASYLETNTRALRELNKLATLQYGTGSEAKARAYGNIFLNSYDPPVAAYFDKLVTDGKFKEAADFLGRATSFETVSTFGLANHPAGWGTNAGRLFGQFGNWPVWARTTLARMLTRGTRQERTRVAARWGMTQGGLMLASTALGLNLNSWYLPTAAPLFSAGQHLSAATDMYDEELTKELQLAAAAVVMGVPGSTLFRGGPAFGLVASAIGAGQAYPQAEREAARTLTELPMLGIPGSFLLRDIYEAAEMSANGDSPVSVWLRALGVRSTAEESLLNPGGITQE